MLTSALTESWHLHEAGVYMSLMATLWRWDWPTPDYLVHGACWSHDAHIAAASSRAEAQHV